MKLKAVHARKIEQSIVLHPSHLITIPTDVPGVVVFVASFEREGPSPADHLLSTAEQLCAAFPGNPREDWPPDERRLRKARRKSATRRG